MVDAGGFSLACRGSPNFSRCLGEGGLSAGYWLNDRANRGQATLPQLIRVVHKTRETA